MNILMTFLEMILKRSMLFITFFITLSSSYIELMSLYYLLPIKFGDHICSPS